MTRVSFHIDEKIAIFRYSLAITIKRKTDYAIESPITYNCMDF